MTPQAIMDGMAEKNRMLTQKNSEYKDLLLDYAEKKRAYRIALKRAYLTEKSGGQSITLIPKIANGEASDAEFDMIVSEGIMKACLESIKDIRSQIDSYRSLLTWLREELHRA